MDKQFSLQMYTLSRQRIIYQFSLFSEGKRIDHNSLYLYVKTEL